MRQLMGGELPEGVRTPADVKQLVEELAASGDNGKVRLRP